MLPTPSTSEFLSRTPQYSHLYPPESSHGLIPPPLPNGELPTNASFYGATYEDLLPSPVNVRFDTSSGFGQGQGPAPGGGGEEDGVNTGCTTGAGDGPRKKVCVPFSDLLKHIQGPGADTYPHLGTRLIFSFSSFRAGPSLARLGGSGLNNVNDR